MAVAKKESISVHLQRKKAKCKILRKRIHRAREVFAIQRVFGNQNSDIDYWTEDMGASSSSEDTDSDTDEEEEDE